MWDACGSIISDWHHKVLGAAKNRAKSRKKLKMADEEKNWRLQKCWLQNPHQNFLQLPPRSLDV